MEGKITITITPQQYVEIPGLSEAVGTLLVALEGEAASSAASKGGREQGGAYKMSPKAQQMLALVKQRGQIPAKEAAKVLGVPFRAIGGFMGALGRWGSDEQKALITSTGSRQSRILTWTGPTD